VNNMERLARKFETARQHVPKPEVFDEAGAEIGIIGYGTSHWADRGEPRAARARDRRARATCACAPIRSPRARRFLDRYQRIYVVEQNRDAQMLGLMRLELPAERIAKLRSVLHYNGLPIDARSVTDDILVQEGRKSRAPRGPTSCRPAARGRGMIGKAELNHERRRDTHGHENSTASASRCSLTAAARRRCAPGAGTTPSPSASSTPSSRWAWTRAR
jgi:hypothetical protein